MTKLRKLFESEMEKAEIQLAVRDIADTLQKMASDISRTTVDDVPAVVERIKASFGVAVGNRFGQSITTQLNELTQKILETKSNIDDETFVISGDASASDLDVNDMEGDETEIDMDAELDLGDDLGGDDELELDLPEEPELGRKVKESREYSEDGRGKFKVSYTFPDGKNVGNDRFETKEEATKYKKDLEKKGYTDVYLGESTKPLIKEAGMSKTEAQKVVKRLETKKASGKKLNPGENSQLNMAKGILKIGDKKDIVKESSKLYPIVVKRLMEKCDSKKKAILESMYNAGPEQRRKVIELAKKSGKK